MKHAKKSGQRRVPVKRTVPLPSNPPPLVTQGHQTSEHRLARAVFWVAALVQVASFGLDALAQVGIGQANPALSISAKLLSAGVLLISQLGYTRGRVALKLAALAGVDAGGET